MAHLPDSVVEVQQVPGGDRAIDNSAVPNAAAPGGTAHRQRVEQYGASGHAVAHLAQGTLPASGAFTAQGLTQIPAGHTRVTYIVTYTRGAPGGFAVLRPKWANGTVFHSIVIVRRPVSVGAFARRRIFLDELQGPEPADNTPISFEIPMRVPPGADACQLVAAEGGAVGTPGDIEIEILTGTE